MLKEHTTTNESDELLNGDGAQKIRPVKLLSRVKLLLLIDIFVGYGYAWTVGLSLHALMLWLHRQFVLLKASVMVG